MIKLMVASREVTHSDAESLWVGTEEIESVKEFLHLGSVVACGKEDSPGCQSLWSTEASYLQRQMPHHPNKASSL